MASYEKLPTSSPSPQHTATEPAPKLERQLSATPRSIGLEGPDARRTRRICFVILLASTLVIAGLFSVGRTTGWSRNCVWMWKGLKKAEGRVEGQLEELKNLKRHHGGKLPKYSTSIDREGQTEVFVYTTAPIVSSIVCSLNSLVLKIFSRSKLGESRWIYHWHFYWISRDQNSQSYQ